MSDLKELLQGAGEAKRQLFAGEDFAGGYGRSVVSRVKRRRAVTATAMGGGTVVTVGALAFGGSNVPWGSFGMGTSPVGTPSVVCATPAAAAAEWTLLTYVPGVESGSLVPMTFERDGLTVTNGEPTISVVEAATGQTTLIDVLDEGVTVRVRGSGTEETLSSNADGTYNVPLPNKRYIALRITLAPGVPRSPGLQTEDYRIPKVEVAIDPPGLDPVKCLTTTPEPSPTRSEPPIATPSVRPSPDISASPSASPEPSASDGFYSDTSPFQCRYKLPTDEHWSSHLGVRIFPQQTATLNGGVWNRINEVLAETGGASGTWPQFEAALTGDSAENATIDNTSVDDPSNGGHLYGLSFVAVRDGVVVGTVEPSAEGTTPRVIYYKSPDSGTLFGFLMSNDPTGMDALTPCAGTATGLEGAELYGVAGYNMDTGFPGSYSWRNSGL